MEPFEITILSGKGGTGKTTICASFIALAYPDVVSADLDVDASNLPILLDGIELEREPFTGMELAQIDPERCSKCGICMESCQFNAIDKDITIMEERCEGCGVCEIVCPTKAVRMIQRNDGDLLVSSTRFGMMVHGDLRPGGEGSGKLVNLIRKRAGSISRIEKRSLMISDGPPGIGCPVISSLTGTDLAVIVTEPSVSGISDMKRILELCLHFKVKAVIIINRYDVDPAGSRKIEDLADKFNVEIIGKIEFDRSVLDALSSGRTIIEHDNLRMKEKLMEIWDTLENGYIKAKDHN